MKTVAAVTTPPADPAWMASLAEEIAADRRHWDREHDTDTETDEEA